MIYFFIWLFVPYHDTCFEKRNLKAASWTIGTATWSDTRQSQQRVHLANDL